jgi:hypothetical protein
MMITVWQAISHPHQHTTLEYSPLELFCPPTKPQSSRFVSQFAISSWTFPSQYIWTILNCSYASSYSLVALGEKARRTHKTFILLFFIRRDFKLGILCVRLAFLLKPPLQLH